MLYEMVYVKKQGKLTWNHLYSEDADAHVELSAGMPQNPDVHRRMEYFVKTLAKRQDGNKARIVLQAV